MKRLFAVVLLGTLSTVLPGCVQKKETVSAVKMDVQKEAPAAVEAQEAVTVPAAVSADAATAPVVKVAGKTQRMPFRVYTDAKSPDNHYIPSGWMGDYGDLKFNDKFMEKPHSGTTSIQIGFSNKATQGARWSGIYWQNPPNNWGTRPGGFDLTGAKKLTFWARGEKGGERIEEFKMGGITGEYADSDSAGIGPVVLTTEWQQFTIDLESKDLSSISGGFCWATNLDVNPEGGTFYLDDIKYE